MKRFIVVIIAIILLITPLMINAVEVNNMPEAVVNATKDADADFNALLWFGEGLLLGVIGVGIACANESSPDYIKFMGKSPKYMVAYTNTYKKELTNAKIFTASAGCLLQIIILFVLNNKTNW